jgi:lipopolysaccharide cholinephosphotransferase
MITDLRLYQLLTLKVLNELNKHCLKMGLNYYLIAGTLLGAKRHQGYIPWDSDIDVAMFRDDYEKFLRNIKKDFSDYVFLQSDYSDINNKTCFARLRLKGTSVIEKGNHNSLQGIEEENGFYIDIFPLDNFPRKSPNILDAFFLKLFKIGVRLKAFKAGKRHSSSRIKTIIGYFIGITGFFIGKNFLNKCLGKWIARHRRFDTKYVTNYNSKYGLKKQTMHKSIYGKAALIKFEGLEFPAPKKNIIWLNKIYGSWEKTPLINDGDICLNSNAYIYDFGKYEYLKGKEEPEVRSILNL